MQKWKKLHLVVIAVLLMAMLSPVVTPNKVNANSNRINLTKIELQDGQVSLKWDAYVEIGKEFDRIEIIRNGENIVFENPVPILSEAQGDGLFTHVEYEYVDVLTNPLPGATLTYQILGMNQNNVTHHSEISTITMPGVEAPGPVVPGDPTEAEEGFYLGLDKVNDESITIFFYTYGTNKVVNQYKILVDGVEVGQDADGLYRIGNLTPDTEYEIKVVAVDENGQTILETTENFSTIKAPTGAVVTFPDKGLEEAIKEELGLERDLLESDLAYIDYLDVTEKGITNVTGIERLVNLETLNLSHNQIKDVTPLAQLSKLDDLDLRGNPVSNGTPLGQITSLTSLDLSLVNIKDFSFIRNLSNLSNLRLDENHIENVDFLSGLKNLAYITLYDNFITNLDPILTIPTLEVLELKNNPISDLSGIEVLEKLKILDLRLTNVTDISVTEKFDLYELALGYMPKLDLSENSPARNTIKNLEEKGVHVGYYDPAIEVKDLLHVSQVTTDSISVTWDDYHNYSNLLIAINGDYYSVEEAENTFNFKQLKPDTNYYLIIELVDKSSRDVIHSTLQVRTLPIESNDPNQPNDPEQPSTGEGNTDQPGTGDGGSEKPGTGNNQGTEQSQNNNGSKEQNTNTGAKTGQETKKVTTAVTTVKGNQATVSTNEVEKVATGGTFMVNLEKETKEEIDVVITKEQIQKLKEKGAALAVKNEEVTLHIPIGIFADENTSVTLKKLPTVTNAVSDVYDFTITQDNKVVSQFSQPITLTFNVNLDGVKDPSKLKVFYYNEKTGKWENIGGTFANGVVTAETSHFSTYTVFESNEPTVSSKETGSVVARENEGEKLPNTATSMFNYLVIGMILFLIGASLLLVNRRKQA